VDAAVALTERTRVVGGAAVILFGIEVTADPEASRGDGSSAGRMPTIWLPIGGQRGGLDLGQGLPWAFGKDQAAMSWLTAIQFLAVVNAAFVSSAGLVPHG